MISKRNQKSQYVRVYERNKLEENESQLIDVTISKSKNADVIQVPPSLKLRVSLSQEITQVRNTPPLTLIRPASSRHGSKYSRSSSSMFYGLNSNTREINPAQSLLPFLEMTNALQLYLKFRLLKDDEVIRLWTTGSFVRQSSVFLLQPKKKWFGRTVSTEFNKPVLHFPGYLLVTDKFVYVFRPLFRIAGLKKPLESEQTCYTNPSRLLIPTMKFAVAEIKRLDVGPGRQYLAFHTQKDGQDVLSFVFETRSRITTTQIVDELTTILHEGDSVQHSIIQQDVEWCIKNIQSHILLQIGPKLTSIFQYRCFNSSATTLSKEEFDVGIEEKITKVDFDFLKLYICGGLISYSQSEGKFDADVLNVTTLVTKDYIYLLQERLDAWPPAQFPSEFGIKFDSLNIFQNHDQKGLLIDKIPQYESLGVGRVRELTSISLCRVHRIDQSFGEIELKLGRLLQNGHLGAVNNRRREIEQQGTTGGWVWWARICFGAESDRSAPINIPDRGYWWDMVFETKESSQEFVSILKKFNENLVVTYGDE